MRFLWAYFSFGAGDRVTFSYSALLSSMADGLCLVVSTDAIIRKISSRVCFLTRHVAVKLRGRIYGWWATSLKGTSKMVDLWLRMALVGLSSTWSEEVLPVDKESNRLDDRNQAWRERIHHCSLRGYWPLCDWQLSKSDTCMSNQ